MQYLDNILYIWLCLRGDSAFIVQYHMLSANMSQKRNTFFKAVCLKIYANCHGHLENVLQRQQGK
jgi:hypothetical protein